MLVEDYFFLRVETCKRAGELCRKYWFLKHFLRKNHRGFCFDFCFLFFFFGIDVIKQCKIVFGVSKVGSDRTF